jgi:hypothetical protein
MMPTIPHDGLPTLAWTLVLAGSITGCGGSSQLDEIFGSQNALETLRRPQSAQAYHLKSQFADEDGNDGPKVNAYQTIGEPVDIPSGTRVRIAKTLLSTKSYLWDRGKGCVPDYGVRISFDRGDDRVDIVFCFECDVLAVYHDNRLCGGADFDPAHDSLVAEMKSLFPNDKAIQGLR